MRQLVAFSDLQEISEFLRKTIYPTRERLRETCPMQVTLGVNLKITTNLGKNTMVGISLEIMNNTESSVSVLLRFFLYKLSQHMNIVRKFWSSDS